MPTIRRLSPPCGFLFLVAGALAAGPVAPPGVGGLAPDFTLKTLADGAIRLDTLTERGPVVLVVLRGWPGYECPACTAQVAELVRNAGRFRERKARVVLLYPGPAEALKAHAQDFASGKGLPDDFDLVLDPDFAVTRAYGLRWDAPGETAYPSTFVIGPGRKVAFAKVSHGHGGRVKAPEILQALGMRTGGE